MSRDPAELRTTAALLKERALEAIRRKDPARAVVLVAEADDLLEEVGRLERGRTHLHPSRKVSTLPSVDSPAIVSRGAAISAAKTKANTRWQQKLKEHGLSIPGWVEAQPKKTPVSIEQARSWVKPRGKGGRAIPAAWAERLAAQFQDPELTQPDSWPCGIR